MILLDIINLNNELDNLNRHLLDSIISSNLSFKDKLILIVDNNIFDYTLSKVDPFENLKKIFFKQMCKKYNYSNITIDSIYYNVFNHINTEQINWNVLIEAISDKPFFLYETGDLKLTYKVSPKLAYKTLYDYALKTETIGFFNEKYSNNFIQN